jgi:hypothetical protein
MQGRARRVGVLVSGGPSYQVRFIITDLDVGLDTDGGVTALGGGQDVVDARQLYRRVSPAPTLGAMRRPSAKTRRS